MSFLLGILAGGLLAAGLGAAHDHIAYTRNRRIELARLNPYRSKE